jgi:hypothetical protein
MLSAALWLDNRFNSGCEKQLGICSYMGNLASLYYCSHSSSQEAILITYLSLSDCMSANPIAEQVAFVIVWVHML